MEVSVNSGPNKVRVTGNFTLPDTWDELPNRSSANLGIAAMVTDPERYVPGLNATSLATGSVALMTQEGLKRFFKSPCGISACPK